MYAYVLGLVLASNPNGNAAIAEPQISINVAVFTVLLQIAYTLYQPEYGTDIYPGAPSTVTASIQVGVPTGTSALCERVCQYACPENLLIYPTV